MNRIKGFAKWLLYLILLFTCFVSFNKATVSAAGSSFSYSSHIQSIGWQNSVTNGQTSGTTGQSKRMEAIKISLTDLEYPGSIEYRSHIQSYGWLDWTKDGKVSGTEGKGKRLEAVQIKLTGEIASHYDIYYRAHAQKFGWLDWAKNGLSAGTAGMSYRVEAIEIRLVPKGEAAPGSTARPYVEVNEHLAVQYTTHVQNYGWLNAVVNGNISGTIGEAKRMEAIRINLKNFPVNGGIEYSTHIQSYGWLDWAGNGAVGGTTGQAKRMEAIRIRLNGELADHFDIYYRVHSEKFGWLDWAKNGASAGTEGFGYRMEAIQIRLVQKGQKAPGSTAAPYYKYNPVGIATEMKSAVQNQATNVQLNAHLSYATIVKGSRLPAPANKVSAFLQSTTSGHKINLNVAKTNNPLIFRLSFNEKDAKPGETYRVIGQVEGVQGGIWTLSFNKNTLLGKLTTSSNNLVYQRDRTPLGQLTIKNFLQTALKPVGKTLYVWGGGWNEADTGSGPDSVTIGVSPQWEKFFNQYGSNYDWTKTKYQIRNGLDCSGYMGWVLYNTVNTVSGKDGYVVLADKTARNYSDRGWGTYTYRSSISKYRPGDILSSADHVYIVLGTASDGSLVIVHSSPNGVMINGTPTPSGNTNSRAAQLATQYMTKYHPQWIKKFPKMITSSSYLMVFDQMSWNVTGNSLLTDPEGLRNKSAEQILPILFGE